MEENADSRGTENRLKSADHGDPRQYERPIRENVMPKYERFLQTLDAHRITPAIVMELNAGFEDIDANASPQRMRSYFSHAMTVLERRLSRRLLVELMADNVCCRTSISLARVALEFATEHKNMSAAERVPLIVGICGVGQARIREDGKLFILAEEHIRDGKFYCACPSINTGCNHEEPVSRTYCMCCAAHYRYYYELMLGCRLRLNRVQTSPLDSDGNEPCSFLFDVVEEY